MPVDEAQRSDAMRICRQAMVGSVSHSYPEVSIQLTLLPVAVTDKAENVENHA